MKIVVMGEGPTDVGCKDYYQTGFREGPVCVLLRRMLGNNPFEIIFKEKADRKKNDKKRGKINHRQRSLSHLKGQGIFSYWAKEQAIEEGADAVLFYSDSDREGGKDCREYKVCKKRFDEVKEGIEGGFLACKGKSKIYTMAVVAVKMIESWLMADPESFDKAFGKLKNRKANQIFPKNPELEWGAKTDPQSNYPKNQIKRILSLYQQESNREVFQKLAEEADINVIKEKCPISFEDFYMQIEGLKNKPDS